MKGFKMVLAIFLIIIGFALYSLLSAISLGILFIAGVINSYRIMY